VGKTDTSPLNAALTYLQQGMPVIPIRPDKKPHLETWKPYQEQGPTEEEVRQWWTRWPGAMVGIVTGKISGVTVVDCDTAEGYEAVQEMLPDSLLIPTAETPRGGKHLYFQTPTPPLGNATGFIEGVDFRGEGGYIIAPPSINGSGHGYRWLLSLDDAPLPPLPSALHGALLNKKDSTYKRGCRHFVDTPDFFREGRRDETLFSIASALVRRDLPENLISQTFDILADNCIPPFPRSEAAAKIGSARARVERRDRSLAEEVKEWVLSTNGSFLSPEVASDLQLSTREDRKNLSAILRRLAETGVIERYGNKNGQFRRIDKTLEVMDLENAPTAEFPVTMPLGIESLCRLYPGNLAICAGSKSSGKTAFLLNVARMNMERVSVTFLSSEAGATEMRTRVEPFGLPLSAWRNVTFVERRDAWADVITGDHRIFIVDYLDLTEDLYRVGTELKAIHSKLRDGIAFIGLQKRGDRDVGYGGTFSMEKARLYVSMDHGTAKITDAKAWRDPGRNPRGLVRTFKLAAGCKFLSTSEWGGFEDGGSNLIFAQTVTTTTVTQGWLSAPEMMSAPTMGLAEQHVPIHNTLKNKSERANP